MSIISNIERVGNFTSSEIYKLFAEPTAAAKKQGDIFGKGALTYIREKNMERRLKRSLDDEKRARPLLWGKMLESRVFDLLSVGYTVIGDVTDVHKEIPYWAGSKDCECESGNVVGDVKCPITLKSFCDLVQPLYDGFTGMDAMNAIRDIHADGEKYYLQIVSNACISGAKFGELIVYMPYQSELEEIKFDVLDNPDYGWVKWALDGELPFLIDGGYYKNLNIIRFEIPDTEKDRIKDRVLEAGKLLISEPSVLLAHYDPELKSTIIQ